MTGAGSGDTAGSRTLFRAGCAPWLPLASVTLGGWWLDQPQPGHATAPWSVSLLLAGAAWYGLIAVLWAAALPMLTVRQKMDALYEVLGVYLQLKSRLLEPVRGIDLERRRLSLALHNGRVVEALQIYFVAQDVHERVTSSHNQYDVLVNAFFHRDVLYRCQRLLDLLGQDCLTLARVIQQRCATTLRRLAQRISGTVLGLVVGWTLLRCSLTCSRNRPSRWWRAWCF